MKLQKLLSKLRQCVQDYRLISPGDRIAVGLSGGKDSLTLLTLLKEYQRFSPAPFGLCAVTVDLGFSSADPAQLEALKQYCDRLEVESHIVPSQIGEVVFDISGRATRAVCAPRCAAARSTRKPSSLAAIRWR